MTSELGRRARRSRGFCFGFIAIVSALASSACQDREASTFSFYGERIAPILDVGCQRQTTGCHVDDGRGFALGNLDLSSYDSLMRRHDVLHAFGPYPVGLLLLKAGNAAQIDVRTIDPPDPTQPNNRHVSITTDVRHAAGEGAISQGSRDYSALKQWIDGGYTRNGVPVLNLRSSSGSCSHTLITRDYIDTTSAPADMTSYNRFVSDVAPVMKQRCAGSNCHGSIIADMYLTCGDNDAELRWNYELALRYLDDVPASSELLRRPLADSAGGVFHEGGDIFADVDDADYRKILAWAESTVQSSPQLLDFGDADDGLRFFANRVQPLLVRKGCMFLNCHSPSMFHDLRLRSGSQGFFSEVAIRKNYELSRQFLATDSADPNQSRLIAKNLCPLNSGGHGIQHRGGLLFEDFGGCALPETQAAPDKCAGVDADGGDLNQIPAYCVLARWHDIERNLAITRGELPSAAGPSGVVFVARPEGIGNPADFDTFKSGADLLLADATVDAQGALTLGAPRSLLAGCGLSGSVDVRGPAVSWDAKHIAVAARNSASAPLHIYQMNADGSQCAQLAGLGAGMDQQNGILIHDFDPSYAPDGRIVFASTRGNIAGGGAHAPTRTPAALAPNANLYVFAPSDSNALRQLTFLSNQEFAPSFMSDGRVIMTTEKRALDFHQFAARRQNLDGGDYHPLIAQRPSVGFDSATEVIELANKNFALVAAGLDAVDGAGDIVIVNRSIGPDQFDRDPSDRSFVHSLTSSKSGAFGNANIFRSPAALPSGRLLVSCDSAHSDPSQGPHHYALCELDTTTNDAPRVLWQDATRVALEASPIWARAKRTVVESRPDEVNGSAQIEAGEDDAVVHFMDVPMLSTLLFSNTRIGRPIPDDVGGLELFQVNPPPSDAQSFAGLSSNVVSDSLGQFYQDLHSLGHAQLAPDGAVRVRIAGGIPISLGLLDADEKPLTFAAGAAFSGPMRQREEMQFYPGERVKQSMPRRLFNGVCAGCHGSISGRELDAVVSVDVLSGASITLADENPLDLR
jgi:hypothetical protein